MCANFTFLTLLLKYDMLLTEHRHIFSTFVFHDINVSITTSNVQIFRKAQKTMIDNTILLGNICFCAGNAYTNSQSNSRRLMRLIMSCSCSGPSLKCDEMYSALMGDVF